MSELNELHDDGGIEDELLRGSSSSPVTVTYNNVNDLTTTNFDSLSDTTTTMTSNGRKNVHVSKNFHRRFESVEQYVQELGGNKGIVITKVLIANNGVAAVKAIRSIRRWAYEVFGNERAIQFVVMATPEDLR
jgi:Biotin carboxylase, N-terminal domain